jgi:hypothetical protein
VRIPLSEATLNEYSTGISVTHEAAADAATNWIMVRLYVDVTAGIRSVKAGTVIIIPHNERNDS